jgi:hypothetical protein
VVVVKSAVHHSVYAAFDWNTVKVNFDTLDDHQLQSGSNTEPDDKYLIISM